MNAVYNRIVRCIQHVLADRYTRRDEVNYASLCVCEQCCDQLGLTNCLDRIGGVSYLPGKGLQGMGATWSATRELEWFLTAAPMRTKALGTLLGEGANR